VASNLSQNGNAPMVSGTLEIPFNPFRFFVHKHTLPY
jgi:hypothetical protein